MWWILWLSLIVVFGVFEAATPQLTTIWFALGSAAALVVSLILPDVLWLQILVFIVISAIAVAVTRPLVKKFFSGNKNRLNADRFIGEEGIVTEDIDNISGKGQINSKGTIWSARSNDDEIKIYTGEKVRIIRIEGVKVIVEKTV